MDSPRDGEPNERRDLQPGYREGDDEVAEHEECARHRRGEQLALSAALPVDDHAESEEDVFSGMSNPTVPIATYDSYRADVCNAVFRAGAITSANSTGVSSGTTSSRGVRAVSARRRPASVRSDCVCEGRRGRAERGLVRERQRTSGFSFRVQAASASRPPVRRR